MIKQDVARIKQFAALLSEISLDFFKEIDKREPEYRTFLSLSKEYANFRPNKFDVSLALMGIGTGLIDFQQKDPGRTLWQPMERFTRKEGYPINVKGIRDIIFHLAKSSRFGNTKLKRAERFFTSGFPSWFLGNDLLHLRKNPYDVWLRLSGSMGDPMNKKTIVMAMKAFDMETLAVTNEYLPFPPHIPMMIDSRITYVSISSGIVVVDPILSIDEIASRYRDELVDAWSEVVERVQKNLGNKFNALRLDSLIWQAGEHRTQLSVKNYLRSFGLPMKMSSKLASNLLLKEVHSIPARREKTCIGKYVKTEKMKAFAKYVSDLNEKGIGGKEYRDLTAEWREKWKRNHKQDGQG